MAREYKVVEIDGIKYELHGVKVENKSIGTVPVRLFPTPQDFRNFIAAETDDDETELHIADWKYGNGVRLQGMARKATTGEAFSDAIYNKMFNQLEVDTLVQFAGKGDELRKHCKQMYATQQAELGDDADSEHVWEELL